MSSAPSPATKALVTKARVQLGLRVAMAGMVLVAALYGWNRTEQFLIHDVRFVMSGPDGVDDASVIQIQGAAHASRRAVESTFASDMGRSVYLLPLAERRATLRTIDWVKEATVARVWPNRVVIHLTERQPVAFVTLAPSRFGLIDGDGIILPPTADRFHLPVLRGVRASDAIADRRDRVQRMQRVLRDLGDNAAKIAEVDVTDRGDIRVMQPHDGHMVTLILGDQRFALRYQNFLNHYTEIHDKLPGAAVLDLRLEDRITVVDEPGGA